jgi:pimeloyl-ACP methyl ester carboxylesterase
MSRQPELASFNRTPDVGAVALVLPGGAERSHGRYWRFIDVPLRGVCRRMADAGAAHGLAVHLLRYRYRGWNGAAADTAADTRWALARLGEAYGPVPVALVGNSLGGRAAFWVAGEPAVAAVVGIAPWLPAGDPVDQLAGRKVLILHGDRDRSSASAAMSLAYAQRARQVVPDLARIEVIGDNHLLLRRAAEAWGLAAEFVLGTVAGRPLPPLLRAAMAARGTAGLSTPLPRRASAR